LWEDPDVFFDSSEWPAVSTARVLVKNPPSDQGEAADQRRLVDIKIVVQLNISSIAHQIWFVFAPDSSTNIRPFEFIAILDLNILMLRPPYYARSYRRI
jgi:hypothetical protein